MYEEKLLCTNHLLDLYLVSFPKKFTLSIKKIKNKKKTFISSKVYLFVLATELYFLAFSPYHLPRRSFRVVAYTQSLLYVIENPLTSSQFHFHISLSHHSIEGFSFTHFPVAILPILGKIVPFSSSDLKLLRQ